MSFDYEVLDEAQAQKAREFPLLPDGIYDFVVTESKFKYSSQNNPMIELKIRIVHDGVDFNVFDNLIGTKNMIWKTLHFCETTGLEREYQAKEFNEKIAKGRRGTCSIKNVPARPKPNNPTEFYKAKNEVEDYLSADKLNSVTVGATIFNGPATIDAAGYGVPASTVPPMPGSEPFHDDDIAF